MGANGFYAACVMSDCLTSLKPFSMFFKSTKMVLKDQTWRCKCKCFAKGDAKYIFNFPFLRNDFLDYVIQTGKISRSIALTELLAIWEWNRFISIFTHYLCESTPFPFMSFLFCFFAFLFILVLFWGMGVHACMHACTVRVCVCSYLSKFWPLEHCS